MLELSTQLKSILVCETVVQVMLDGAATGGQVGVGVAVAVAVAVTVAVGVGEGVPVAVGVGLGVILLVRGCG